MPELPEVRGVEVEDGDAEEDTPLDDEGVFSVFVTVLIVIGDTTCIWVSLPSMVDRWVCRLVFIYDGAFEDIFAEMASFEVELDSTERLSQKALSLSGLSIRWAPFFMTILPPGKILLWHSFPLIGFCWPIFAVTGDRCGWVWVEVARLSFSGLFTDKFACP